MGWMLLLPEEISCAESEMRRERERQRENGGRRRKGRIVKGEEGREEKRRG